MDDRDLLGWLAGCNVKVSGGLRDGNDSVEHADIFGRFAAELDDVAKTVSYTHLTLPTTPYV